MSTGERNSNAIIAPGIAIGLVLVSVFSLIAFFALSAYAPDFRDESDGGAHALSKSAIGYAGMLVLLEAAGISGAFDRGARAPGDPKPGLIVLTPPPGADGKDVLDAAIPDAGTTPTLIVLPKWEAFPDPTAFGRVLKAMTLPTKTVEGLLKSLSSTTRIAQKPGTAPPGLSAADPAFADVPAKPAFVDTLQTISGPEWTPLIANGKGGTVLARLTGSQVYVLADPDLMNTHGLHDLPTAALALSIVKRLRTGGGPIAFDLTLNGMGRSPSLLRAMFAPPFLGATLCAILAAALIGFHAAVRFGSPPLKTPVYARGKTALVVNAADMIRMLRREPNMAVRYAQTTRNLAAGALGIRRQAEPRDGGAQFKGIEPESGPAFSELLNEAGQVNSRAGLLALARKLYEWRQGMIHAR